MNVPPNLPPADSWIGDPEGSSGARKRRNDAELRNLGTIEAAQGKRPFRRLLDRLRGR